MPTVSFPGGVTNADATALHHRLEEVAVENSDKPMVLELISAAVDWLEGDRLRSDPPTSDRAASPHKQTPSTSSASPEIPTHKADRMRMAREVIARIRWDGDLEEADFTVTYLDRFRGEVEMEFAAVDWDASPFPQHRIQCFKFRGVTVWDKRTCLDRVFGSRGDRLRIEDIIRQPREEGTAQRGFHTLCIPIKGARATPCRTGWDRERPLPNAGPSLVVCSFVLNSEVAMERLISCLRAVFVAALPEGTKIKVEGFKWIESECFVYIAKPKTELLALTETLDQMLRSMHCQTRPLLHDPFRCVFQKPSRDGYGKEGAAEADLVELDVEEMTLLDPDLKLVASVGNGLATLRPGLPAVIQSRLKVLHDDGNLHAEEWNALNALLETEPGIVQNRELMQAVQIPCRAQLWETKQIAGLLLLIQGSAEERQRLLDNLEARFLGSHIRVKSVDADLEDGMLEELEVHRQMLDALIEAAEDEEEIVVLNSDRLEPWQLSTFERLGAVLGYRMHSFNLEYSLAEDVVRPPGALQTGSRSRFEADLEFLLRDESWNRQSGGGSSQQEEEVESVAVFLTARSRTELVRKFPPVHTNVSADRLCLFLSPTPQRLRELPPLGTGVRMQVEGILSSPTCQAALVKFVGKYRGTLRSVTTPLIHISSVTPPDEAQPIAASIAEATLRPVTASLQLTGILGAVMHCKTQSIKRRKVIWPDRVCIAPCPVIEDPPLSARDVRITHEKDKGTITQLDVFDFDGTLVSSRDEMDGRREYSERVGLAFPHVGWYGRQESLSPPVRVLPGPAMRDCLCASGRANTWTLVLTGRLQRVRPAVARVLEMYGVSYDELICKSSSGDSADFKAATLHQFLQKFNRLEKIKIWEDNVENLVKFYEIQRLLQDRLEMEIIEAPTLPLTRSLSADVPFSWEDRGLMSGLGAFFEAIGAFPGRLFYLHAEAGISFLVELWREVLEVELRLHDLHFVTGPHAFGRRDAPHLWLLAPNNLERQKCCSLLGEALFRKRLNCDVADNTLTVQLAFEACCPMCFCVGFLRMGEGWCPQSGTPMEVDVGDAEGLRVLGEVRIQEECLRVKERSPRRCWFGFRVALELLARIWTKATETGSRSAAYATPGLANLILKFWKLSADSSGELPDKFCLCMLEWISGLTFETLLSYAGAEFFGSPEEKSPDADLSLFHRRIQDLRPLWEGADVPLRWTVVYDIVV